MAIFSKKIVSAKFINSDNTVIEVLYTEGDNIIPFILEVDYSNNDFKDLIDEYTLEQIETNTKEIREQQKKVFEEIIEARVKQRTKDAVEGEKVLLSSDIFTFLDEKANDPDFIFDFKVAMLDSELISNLDDKKLKVKIRKSKSLFELLSIYGDIKANS